MVVRKIKGGRSGRSMSPAPNVWGRLLEHLDRTAVAPLDLRVAIAEVKRSRGEQILSGSGALIAARRYLEAIGL